MHTHGNPDSGIAFRIQHCNSPAAKGMKIAVRTSATGLLTRAPGIDANSMLRRPQARPNHSASGLKRPHSQRKRVIMGLLPLPAMTEGYFRVTRTTVTATGSRPPVEHRPPAQLPRLHRPRELLAGPGTGWCYGNGHVPRRSGLLSGSPDWSVGCRSCLHSACQGSTSLHSQPGAQSSSGTSSHYWRITWSTHSCRRYGSRI